MKVLWTACRAVFAFSVAYYCLHPREATEWLQMHKPVLPPPECRNGSPELEALILWLNSVPTKLSRQSSVDVTNKAPAVQDLKIPVPKRHCP
jgi:hypothetical protein